MDIMSEEMSVEEGFEHALFYFLEALRTLELSAEEQCEIMGNYNVAWEMQHDVSDPISPMLACSASYFTESQSAALLRLEVAMKELPDEALYPEGLRTTGYEGSITAMRHPDWEPLRIQARDLLRILEPVIQRNSAYFERASS